MSLQKQIKADMISAMKNKNEEVKSLLRVVLGEINTLSKGKGRETEEVSDDEVVGIMKKLKESAIEMGNDGEVKILDLYLPSMLGEKQLETLIKGIINKNGYEGKQDMGKVMGFLKSNYGSTYDGRLASKIVMDNLG